MSENESFMERIQEDVLQSEERAEEEQALEMIERGEDPHAVYAESNYESPRDKSKLETVKEVETTQKTTGFKIPINQSYQEIYS